MRAVRVPNLGVIIMSKVSENVVEVTRGWRQVGDAPRVDVINVGYVQPKVWDNLMIDHEEEDAVYAAAGESALVTFEASEGAKVDEFLSDLRAAYKEGGEQVSVRDER